MTRETLGRKAQRVLLVLTRRSLVLLVQRERLVLPDLPVPRVILAFRVPRVTRPLFLGLRAIRGTLVRRVRRVRRVILLQFPDLRVRKVIRALRVRLVRLPRSALQRLRNFPLAPPPL